MKFRKNKSFIDIRDVKAFIFNTMGEMASLSSKIYDKAIDFCAETSYIEWLWYCSL